MLTFISFYTMDNQIIIQGTPSVSNLESFRNEVIQEWQKSGVGLDYILWLFHNFSENGSGLFIADAPETRHRLNLSSLDLSHQEYFWGFKDLFGNIQIKVNLPHRKYMCPKGSTSDAFFLPLMEYPGCKDIKEIMHDFRSVGVAEGLKKCASIISNGNTSILPISITGVNCSLPDFKKRPLLSNFLLAAGELNRHTLIIFDKDWQTNKQVRNALIKTHIAYTEIGLDCSTPEWKSDHKGIDDFLYSLKPNMRRNELEKFAMGFKLTKEQIEERITEIVSTKSSNKTKRLSAQDIMEQIEDEYRHDWKYSIQHDSWFKWNGKYWESTKDRLLQTSILLLLDSRGIRYESPHKLKAIAELLSHKLSVKEWKTKCPQRYINFSNGVYDIEEKKLLPPAQGYMFLSCAERNLIDLELSGDIISDLKKYAPQWYNSYEAICGGNKQKIMKLIAAINGVLTYQFRYLQRFLFLEGKPGSGKSSFARLLYRIVGDKSTTFTSLKKLNSDYTIASLINSQLVCCEDEEKTVGFDNLKKLTGGSNVDYRQIYGMPASAPFYGALVVIAVHNPFAGNTTGIDRRMMHILFNGKFPKRSTAVEEYILENELEPLMAIALSMPEMEVRGYIEETLDYHDHSQLKEKWESSLMTDTVAAWMEDNIVSVNNGQYYPISEFYENFIEYCEQTNSRKIKANRFSAQLSQALEMIGWEHEKKKKSIGGKKENSISGIYLRKRLTPLRNDTYGSISEMLTPPNPSELSEPSEPDSQNVDSESDSAVPMRAEPHRNPIGTASVPQPEIDQKEPDIVPMVSMNTDEVPMASEPPEPDTVPMVPMSTDTVPMVSEPLKPAPRKEGTDGSDEIPETPTQKMFDVIWHDQIWESWEMMIGEFPHRTSNQKAAKQARCGKLIQELMNCAVKEDVEVLTNNPNKEKQFQWVLNILSSEKYLEWRHYLSCMNLSQRSLFVDSIP